MLHICWLRQPVPNLHEPLFQNLQALLGAAPPAAPSPPPPPKADPCCCMAPPPPPNGDAAPAGAPNADGWATAPNADGWATAPKGDAAAAGAPKAVWAAAGAPKGDAAGAPNALAEFPNAPGLAPNAPLPPKPENAIAAPVRIDAGKGRSGPALNVAAIDLNFDTYQPTTSTV